jgi:predicted nucleic acid-binding protein
MARYVIDTNLAIVANGDDENVNIDCRLAAVKLLQKATEKGRIFLDSGGAIQSEYRRYLNPKGQPGVGDRFYLEVINSNPSIITRIDVEKSASGQYVDLPQALIDAGFDPSDRVFAAVAKKSKAKVYNAVDTDWLHHIRIIEENGIRVVFVCGKVSDEWRSDQTYR